MKSRPLLVYADADGNIFDFPELEMVGSSGGKWQRPQPGEWIPLPRGSELFLLPQRIPAGYHQRKRRFEVLQRDPYDPAKPVQAVAAFVAPAHTQVLSAAYKSLPGAVLLPLFAYTSVGWLDGQFVVAAMRVDSDERQDLRHFDPDQITHNAHQRMAREPHNRLVQHLGKCAVSYGCPAARNLFMNRWEAPLPTSPACNARCLGCISFQEREDLCATQDRITFVPTPREIAEVAVPHLNNAPKAVVSFGQGCEGEPLLQADVLRDAILLMRRSTQRGTINLNTNASLPDAVAMLADAGLDSIRVSLNSCIPERYQAYYRPRGYTFEDVRLSIRIMKTHKKFVSLNYFVLPGFTDEEKEFEALCDLIGETGADLIQMRNFNIDPEWYLRSLGLRPQQKAMGIPRLLKRLKGLFPKLRFGYFNPCLDVNAG